MFLTLLLALFCCVVCHLICLSEKVFEPVLISCFAQISTKTCELKTTGTITLENGAMFE